MSCDAAGAVRKKQAQKLLQKLCQLLLGNSWPDNRVVTAQLGKEKRRQLHGIRVWPGCSHPVSPKLWFSLFPRCTTPSKGYSVTSAGLAI